MENAEKLDLRPALVGLACALALMFLLSGYAWLALPPGAQIPTHWNIRGEVDQYSSKAFGLLFLPAMVAAIVPFVLLVVRLDPRRAHVAQSQKFLNVVLGGLLVLMTCLHASTIAITLGHKLPMNAIVLTLTGAFFVVIGNYSGKVRSNFFMGVRTPWTLSSELSWNKTNRLFGRMFMVIGALTIALAWTASNVAVYVIAGGTLLTLPVVLLYSYRTWKHDPARNGSTPTAS